MVLVLLITGGIYDVRRSDGFRWHDIYISRYMKIGKSVQAVLRL
jgi:hypothetical protein